MQLYSYYYYTIKYNYNIHVNTNSDQNVHNIVVFNKAGYVSLQ